MSTNIQRGGFPPIYLAPVNFNALYQAQMQEAAQQALAAPAEGQAVN